MKTRILALAFAALCSLIFSSRAAAQGCYLILTPHFSEYSTRTLDNSNDNVHQTEQLDGYATFGPSASCPMYLAVHTPSVRNVIGSYGGTSYGPGGCASCYFSYSTALDIIVLPGVTYISEQGATMGCNMGGTFWSGGGGLSYVEFAYTQSKFIDVKTNCVTSNRTGITYCDYLIAPSCTPDTSPPDLNPSAVGGSSLFPDPQYYDIKGIGVRFSTTQPFVFLNVDTYAKEVYGPRLPAFCTKNNP